MLCYDEQGNTNDDVGSFSIYNNVFMGISQVLESVW
jgi:hypothetical protein